MRTETGLQRIRMLRPDVFHVRIQGEIRFDPGVVRLTDQLGAWVREASCCTVFMDLDGFTQYDSEVRAGYTQAMLTNRKGLDALYIFANSKIVRMGVSVASIAIAQLRSVGRDAFDDALATALAAPDQNE